MIKYVTRRRPARAHVDDSDLFQTHDDSKIPADVTVFEPDDGPEWTGILDWRGNEICRVSERGRMGFRLRSRKK